MSSSKREAFLQRGTGKDRTGNLSFRKRGGGGWGGGGGGLFGGGLGGGGGILNKRELLFPFGLEGFLTPIAAR